MSPSNDDDAAPAAPPLASDVGPAFDPDAGQVPAPAAGPKPRIALFAASALLVLALDVVSKVLVVAHLPYTHVMRILGGAIYLDQVRNSGAAFSLGTGFTILLTVVALVVVAVILRTARRMHSIGWAVALGFVLGGALGNLTDRLFREPGVGRGHVVDWISVFGPYGQHWPIFNLADSGIVVGAIIAAVLALRGIDIDGSSPRSPRAGAGG